MQIDRRIGVAELIGVLVRRVVGAQILDALEVRADDAEPGSGESLDELLGLLFGECHDDGIATNDGYPVALQNAERACAQRTTSTLTATQAAAAWRSSGSSEEQTVRSPVSGCRSPLQFMAFRAEADPQPAIVQLDKPQRQGTLADRLSALTAAPRELAARLDLYGRGVKRKPRDVSKKCSVTRSGAFAPSTRTVTVTARMSTSRTRMCSVLALMWREPSR